jgi:hypothetical protein
VVSVALKMAKSEEKSSRTAEQERSREEKKR